MLYLFCSNISWHNFCVLFKQLQSRLEHGVTSELLDLMRADSIDPKLARFLYNKKITSLSAILGLSEEEMCETLQKYLEACALLDPETKVDFNSTVIKISSR